MKTLKIYILFFALLFSASTLLAQNFTRIHKNFNSTANGLKHNLNRVGDSIHMKSDKEIYRVSFLSHKEKETVEIDLGSFEANIPLYHFSKGRYTIAVYREDMIIAFDIVRERPIGLPEDAVADLEESILRSSLPEEEQRKRNLKPRKKRNSDTRVASVTPKPDNSKALAQAKKREQNARKKREAEKAKKEQAIAEARKKEAAEKKLKSLAKAEADRVKKEQALADAKVREAKEKKQRELAQVEANRARIKQKALAEAKAKEAKAERARLEKEKSEAQRAKNTVAYTKADRVDDEKEIEVKTVKYNISDIEHDALEKQSREEYRKQNLRPNGTKYEEAIEEERKNKK